MFMQNREAPKSIECTMLIQCECCFGVDVALATSGSSFGLSKSVEKHVVFISASRLS